jgi:hypothetical protein
LFGGTIAIIPMARTDSSKRDQSATFLSNQESQLEHEKQSPQQSNPQQNDPSSPDRRGDDDRKSRKGGDQGKVGQDTDGDGKVVKPGQTPGQSGGKGMPKKN